jgi:uncharacterized protein YeeX (DUF496 family)
MAKGGKRDNAGRPKGVQNKVTKETREAFKEFVEDNQEQFQGWIDRVAETNPAKAIELVSNLAEYVLPKLSRTEIQGEVETKITIDFTD